MNLFEKWKNFFFKGKTYNHDGSIKFHIFLLILNRFNEYQISF